MNSPKVKFALNHMACPTLSPQQLVEAAISLGIEAVELRNDVKENSVTDRKVAETVRRLAEENDIEVLSINALYPFNIWNSERAEKAEELAELVRLSGGLGLVCCPLVDADFSANENERRAMLKEALQGLKPILLKNHIKGFIEPLGFPISSLRFKKEATEVIREVDSGNLFGLVHDTFHHCGSGETRMYPEMTGLVHVSGVEDESISFSDMLDGHRLFVGPKDRLGSVDQVRQLIDSGYKGYISFEPFADFLWSQNDPLRPIRESMDYIQSQLASK
jgi:2-keto-myo-inositol isomerase